jgi:hypothetical protein
VTDLRAYAREAAVRAGIDPERFVRQIDQESGFNPDAYNSISGATGIAQIIPRWHPAVDANDPIASLDYAAGLMATYRRMFGSEAKALAAYNWGSGNVGGYTTPGGVVVPPWDGRRETLPGETRRYIDIVLGPTWDAPRVAYDPNHPAIAQDDEWSCAPTSLRWALHAAGRRPTEDWIERTLLAEGVVSEQLGLLDATGAGLAAFVGRHYGEFSYSASHQDNVSFQALAEEAGPYPILIGGRSWGGGGHWAAVRAYDAGTDTLQLMNPADMWGQVGQTMTREQFATRGRWSMVRITHPDLVSNEPPAQEPPPDPAATIAHLEGVIREYETQLADKDARLMETVALLGAARGDYADRLQSVVDGLRGLAPRA